jgi:hypothetical protein
MQSDVGDETRREAAPLVRDHSYCLSSGTNGLSEGQRLDAPHTCIADAASGDVRRMIS